MADKELVWLHGEVKTPPFSLEARRRAGFTFDSFSEGIRCRCRIPGQCPFLAHDATSCEFLILKKE